MRLIDADKLMEDMQKTITEQSGTIDWLNLIYRQHTAYDMEKVVKRLENDEKHTFDGCINKRYAIEIVKGGGVDAGSI